MCIIQVKQIEAQGGSSKLVALLRQIAPPAPSPPPPPAKKEEPTGTLTVRCQPAECQVSVQGKAAITTAKGAATFLSQTVGEVTVDFGKPGYIGQQRTATIKPEADTSVYVELQPDAGTQAQFGIRLFKAMLRALGATEEAVPKELLAFSAGGSITSFDASGTGTEWNLTLESLSHEFYLE